MGDGYITQRQHVFVHRHFMRRAFAGVATDCDSCCPQGVQEVGGFSSFRTQRFLGSSKALHIRRGKDS
jgi:hypothetical protein